MGNKQALVCSHGHASMGPPILLGGNLSLFSSRGCASSGFNGATDFTRWKFLSLLRLSVTLSSLQWGHRFYSVEIVLLVLRLLTFIHASMGPPILLGGNSIGCPAVREHNTVLQWGHRFYSVEMGRWHPALSHCIRSFNGATDFTRWKWVKAFTAQVEEVGASMGPPILLGGNNPLNIKALLTLSCFNGATDFTRWKLKTIR